MQFYLTVGVITTLIVTAGICWFLASVIAGCFDKCLDHVRDYRYDLNWKSQAKAVVYATAAGFLSIFVLWLFVTVLTSVAQVM